MITLYDLCGADSELRFGPFCWTSKLCLLHKGLPFETVALGFTEKANYPDPDYGKLPILRDGDDLVRDSAAIAEHLDRRYPARPLMATDAERAAAQFYRAWAGAHVFSAIRPFAIGRVLRNIRPEDQPYFRSSREKTYGRSIETVEAEADAKAVTTALAPLAAALNAYPFLGGGAPNFSDYVVAAPLLWGYSLRQDEYFEAPPAVGAWFGRILDLYDGYARRAKRAA